MKVSKYLLFAALSSLSAHARMYNYEEIPLGERHSGMGNVGVALYGDTSALYYNPATLAHSEASQVSASLSTYQRIDTRTGKYVSAFQSAADNVSRGGFISIPSMGGGHVKKGSWVVGLTALQPEGFKNSGSLYISPTDIATYEGSAAALWIGAGVARRYSETNQFGISLFYVSRDQTEKLLIIKDAVVGFQPKTRYIESTFTKNGLLLIIGGTAQVNPDFRIGYSFRTPMFLLGSYGFYTDMSTQEVVGDKKVVQFAGKGSPYPMKFSLGFSWDMTQNWTMAADGHLYSAKNEYLGPPDNEYFRMNAREIANGAIGFEYRGFEGYALRLGGYTNLSSARYVAAVFSALNDKVHMFGGTAAISMIKPSGSVTFGGYAVGGQGSSVPVGDGDLSPTARSNYFYGATIGSSYRF